jgi:hypothetical protein
LTLVIFLNILSFETIRCLFAASAGLATAAAGAASFPYAKVRTEIFAAERMR